MQKVYAAVDIKSVFLGDNTIEQVGPLANSIIQNMFMLAGVVAFVILVFGGFSFIIGAGGGDTKKMEQAKKAITGAVLGLLVVIGSFWVIRIIEVLTGMPLVPIQ